MSSNGTKHVLQSTSVKVVVHIVYRLYRCFSVTFLPRHKARDLDERRQDTPRNSLAAGFRCMKNTGSGRGGDSTTFSWLVGDERLGLRACQGCTYRRIEKGGYRIKYRIQEFRVGGADSERRVLVQKPGAYPRNRGESLCARCERTEGTSK
ncbi:uncharacterized protein LOC143428213 [Xylocopa sonorina]|uniref:uncharacterized protein LOC143428213 n=1 Tax=Xylocopa sonorina TaxID=1818115 RepID=UPI00403B00CA